jgi:hypothetical protein
VLIGAAACHRNNNNVPRNLYKTGHSDLRSADVRQVAAMHQRLPQGSLPRNCSDEKHKAQITVDARRSDDDSFADA